jgi:hypothetical protein
LPRNAILPALEALGKPYISLKGKRRAVEGNIHPEPDAVQAAGKAAERR